MIAVTGTTGKLGALVALRLAERGVEQLLVGRDPFRQPTLPHAQHRGPAAYGEHAAMRHALHGADTLFLVSGGLSGHRLEEHACAIDAAVELGLGRVVYVSLQGAATDATYLNARDHAQTERYLAGSPIRSTVLRAGFYSSMLPGLSDEDGVLRGPADGGRFSAVTHEDIADVAAAVLLDDGDAHDGQVLEVTGPEALTMDEAAAQLTEATGVRYGFEELDAEEKRVRLLAAGHDEVQADGWVSWFAAIGNDEASTVTDVVPRIAGHLATRVADAFHRAVT